MKCMYPPHYVRDVTWLLLSTSWLFLNCQMKDTEGHSETQSFARNFFHSLQLWREYKVLEICQGTSQIWPGRLCFISSTSSFLEFCQVKVSNVFQPFWGYEIKRCYCPLFVCLFVPVIPILHPPSEVSGTSENTVYVPLFCIARKLTLTWNDSDSFKLISHTLQPTHVGFFFFF